MSIVDEIKFGRKNLINADLRDADLSDANLCRADLRRADFRGADLNDANLSGADLSGADLRRANLRGADLRSANLRFADLRDADLRRADLHDADLCVFQTDSWTAYIQKDVITIGCKRHTVKEWMEFTDEEINSMNSNALNYWKQYKDIIFSIHANLEN